METIERMLATWIQQAFQKAFPDLPEGAASIGVTVSTSPEFGDYQSNAAMLLAKQLRKPPREVARLVLDQAGTHPAIQSVSLAGPGFINITLHASWLAGQCEAMQADERLRVPAIGQGRRIVMDYSSPNVAKPMHIGHIRSTVIGSALDRLHRFLGYAVVSDNHIGDWGTQFGILIKGYRHFVDEKALAEWPVEELERLYVKSYEESKKNADWLEACRQELVKLQAGDPENQTLWQRFVALSLDEFGRIYRRLGIAFDLVRGESFYRDQVPAVIRTLEEKGLARESEGALVVFLDEEKLPVCIVRKSDGASNYATTDIATLLSREKEFAPETIVYVTDERQQLHFRQLFAIGRKLGIRAKLEHVWFGLMRLPGAVFSTREGNVIKLERLLDEAEARALAIVRQASPDMPPEQQKEVARAVGMGAVKYADLSQKPQSEVVFSWDKALALDGNSAPYLQYAYARIRSVADKYRERYPAGDLSAHPLRLDEPVERALALQVCRFPDTVILAARLYRPSVLADYLFTLAGIYSTFYQNVPFLKAPDGIRESRVRLCGLVARVLRQGLDILGIETPDRI